MPGKLLVVVERVLLLGGGEGGVAMIRLRRRMSCLRMRRWMNYRMTMDEATTISITITIRDG
jgi:hypothetical protein